jgi:hypothetical protein
MTVTLRPTRGKNWNWPRKARMLLRIPMTNQKLQIGRDHQIAVQNPDHSREHHQAQGQDHHPLQEELRPLKVALMLAAAKSLLPVVVILTKKLKKSKMLVYFADKENFEIYHHSKNLKQLDF